MRQIYDIGYLPIAGTMWLLGAAGWLPRVRSVDERRGPRAPILLRVGVGGLHRAAGVVVPVEGAAAIGRTFDVIKLAVFWGILAYVGNLARRGLLPRTRPILPGEIAVSD